jgi:hypothetical protein
MFAAELAKSPQAAPLDWAQILRRGELSVGVMEASKLLGKTPSGLSNPYVTLSVCDPASAAPQLARTDVVMQSVDPVWNARFEFLCTDPGAVLELQVWSKATGFLQRDRFLGRARVRVADLAPSKLSMRLLELQPRSARSHVAGSSPPRLALPRRGPACRGLASSHRGAPAGLAGPFKCGCITVAPWTRWPCSGGGTSRWCERYA